MPLEIAVKGSFSAAIDAAAEKLQTQLTANVQAFATAVFSDLIDQTPKLSGQATANWQVTVGDVNDVYIELRPRRVYHGEDVQDALEYGLGQIEEFQIGGTLTIFNNSPYINLLNEGYSKQAPAGFIESIIDGNRAVLSTGSVSLG